MSCWCKSRGKGTAAVLLLLVSIVFLIAGGPAEAAQEWEWRSTPSNELRGVTWDGSQFVVVGSNNTILGTPTSTLEVAIEPEGVRTAGAKWSVDDGNTWHDSGPQDLPTGTYTALVTGSLQVTIKPSAARTAGAQWRLTEGPDTTWKDSGDTISDLPPETYTITFKYISDVSTLTVPSDITVDITAGAEVTETGTYTFTGPSFTDVPPSAWYYEYVEMIYAAGITTGWGGSTNSNPIMMSPGPRWRSL